MFLTVFPETTLAIILKLIISMSISVRLLKKKLMNVIDIPLQISETPTINKCFAWNKFSSHIFFIVIKLYQAVEIN